MNCNTKDLQSCYTNCLQLVLDNNIKSLVHLITCNDSCIIISSLQAFCCIATGVYGFPNDKAANIALETVRQWLETGENAEQVSLNVTDSCTGVYYKFRSIVLYLLCF